MTRLGTKRHMAANLSVWTRRAAAAGLVLAMLAGLSGCNILGWGADAVAGGPKKVKVEAEYRGLEGQTAAVLVSADDQMLYEYPGVQLNVSKVISKRLAETQPTVKLTEPQQLYKFQQENPYWHTLPYRQLIQRLGVQRLIIIDLVEYSSHEPGNAHVWNGRAVANVGIVEAQGQNPDALAYSQTVQTQFPDNPVGLLDADDATIQLGLLKNLSEKVVNLFYDHKETVER